MAKLVLAAAASVVSEIAMDRRGGGDNTDGRQRQRRTMSLPSLTLERRAEVIAAVQSAVDPTRL